MISTPLSPALVLAALIAAGQLIGGCAKDRAEGALARPVQSTAPLPCPAGPPNVAGPALDGGKPAFAFQPVEPQFRGDILLPPAPGLSRSQLTGCLQADSDAEATRFPVPQTERRAGEPPSEVRVNALAGGIIVIHELVHACCLKGKLTTSVNGSSVTVMEKLDGTPCDCRCSSTLRSAVGLAPGAYSLRVELEEPDRPRQTVHSQRLRVGTAR